MSRQERNSQYTSTNHIIWVNLAILLVIVLVALLMVS